MNIRIFTLLILSTCISMAATTISGEIIDGYRVLSLKNMRDGKEVTVYRGDYIKIDHNKRDLLFKVPALEIEKELPEAMKEAPFFKMKKVGSYAFTLGRKSGTINVIEFQGPGYRVWDTEQCRKIIKKDNLLILDVRTKNEYKKAHIEGAILLPVQELQKRWGELEKYKNQPVLIYCASGNRSTVASKILIDKGFKSITNMKRGIKGWMKKKNPVVK